ncbi:MAG: hypothetical protein [Podoviridae sp. ctrTa16]|nr:MAG: hypothetical protein [Podoviridae sp. ctrTa16]
MAQIILTIPDEVLKNIFITATEGGSDWGHLSKKESDRVREASPDEKAFSEKLFDAVYYKGLDVEVLDADTNEKIGVLSRKTMSERLQALYANPMYSYAILEEIKEEGDAETSDVVFQYLVMGEVKFS